MTVSASSFVKGLQTFLETFILLCYCCRVYFKDVFYVLVFMCLLIPINRTVFFTMVEFLQFNIFGLSVIPVMYVETFSIIYEGQQHKNFLS